MRIKSVALGAAFACAAVIGSASAAERFSTLGGVPAEPLSAAEMASIKGSAVILRIQGPRNTIIRQIFVASGNHDIEVVAVPGAGGAVVTKD